MAFGAVTNYLLSVTSPVSSGRWPLLPGALLFALLAWQLNFLCDDAYISFRYSRNLAEGHGLRYNLLGEVPVEGYSNLLWVLWLTPFEWLGVAPGSAARWSSTLCGLLLVLWVPAHARRRLQLGVLGTVAVGLFLGSLPAFALWATGGLATMATALLVFGVYERLLGDPEQPHAGQAALLAGLTALVRADGALWVGMILVAGALLWLVEARPRGLLRALLTVAITLVGVVALHVAWRYSYYGHVLPNTARVKVGLSSFRLERGWNYLLTWWLAMPATAIVMLMALRCSSRRTARIALPAWVIVSASLAYAVWVGGDFMPFGRFMFSCTPFLALLLALVWQESWTARAWFARAGLLGVGLCISLNVAGCFDLNLIPESVRQRFHFRLNSPWQSELAMRASMQARTDEWTLQGRGLKLFTRPNESIILAAIGAMGYYSRLEVFDRFGLVSPEVIEQAKPKQSASPGHDIEVATTFFYDQQPSIGGCFLSPIDAPRMFNMPKGWFSHPISKMIEIERNPLPKGQGFPPEMELRILRFTSWPE